MNERFRYPISNDELNFWRKAFGGVLDDLDFKIYFLLRENGRMSDTEMAKRLNVSATTVRRRRLFLQERGYLQIIGILILQELNLAYADVLVKFEKTASEKEILSG
ncbi:Lrp/AsnC family transcriptional regulator [Thermococcus sp. PK]|uniref:Lrp/AsnC family transcriptional regulator n=1 Tax=Thermococcus sp. PK TaxID=913025 RepID=UPI000694C340|nr:Lrp/AsnC family transcriptional regulator [Thermococcus sp. PK]